MKILIDGQTFLTEELSRGIGVYFTSILENMLKNDFVNEFFMVVGDTRNLNVLSAWCRNKLEIIDDSAYSPALPCYGVSADNYSLYSESLYNDLERLDIDIYWNPNPLMNNVCLPEKKNRTRFTCTVHDLIPIIMKDIYFRKWDKKAVGAYLKKIEVMKKYDAILCVSQSTKEDVLAQLRISKDKIWVIEEGVSDFFVPDPFPEVVSEENYILFVGGFDVRKNMFKGLEAFAKLIGTSDRSLYHDLKLYIVCAHDANERVGLMGRAEELGISSRVVLTGFITDQDLLRLYQKAKCLFFPSLYEGFGLPVVEGLACGIPVACSNVSSLPDIAGEFGYFFDPNDTEAMKDVMCTALNAPASLQARQERWEYAKSRFSWKIAAFEMTSTFQGLLSHAPIQINARRRIAWVSPLPPSKTGIADYSNVLIHELMKDVDLVLFYEGDRPIVELKDKFELHHISELKKYKDTFDDIFYHIGNNVKFHKDTYKFAWDYPGTVVLHDWNIHPFLKLSFIGTEDEHYYYEAMLEGYGEQGRKELNNLENGEVVDVFKFPMCDALVMRSNRVIIHNMWAKRRIIDNGKVDVVPILGKIACWPNEDEIRAYRAKHVINETHFIVSCMGFINTNKQPYALIKALEKLLSKNLPVTMLFAGELSSEVYSLIDYAHKRGLTDHVVFTGYQKERDYYRAMFASDVIVNLRSPTMGEGSMTLLQAITAGKPTIVSDACQYKEFPDSVCWKVPDEDSEVYLYQYLDYLLSHKEVLHKMSKNVKEYGRLFRADRIAAQYLYSTKRALSPVSD
jgi:glycosyltransferase involved in cell wall biosynthesis